MNKTVIFLGAGASRAEGAPLQNNLFKSFFEPTDHMNNRILMQNQEVSLKNNIRKFFSLFYGIDDIYHLDSYRDFNFPTFEEALGILEIAISREEEYKNQKLNLIDFKNSLVYIMAQAIENKLDFCTRQEEFHNNLVSKVINSDANENISFISTNYDLLIDNAILKKNWMPNYGFNDFHIGVNLFKLHGSLNWLYCPTCKKIEKIDGQKVMISVFLSMQQTRCNLCNTKRKYVIIPPTYFKNYSNHYLASVWNRAEEILTKAEHIVICGYSFPDADIHIKYLLKRAEMNRQVNSHLKISVFNYHLGKDQNVINDEKLRYVRFFKQTTNVIYHEKISFENFVENVTDYLSD